MRRQIRFAIMGALGLLLALVASQALGAVKNYDILLTPQGPSGTLNANLAFGGNCDPPTYPGCMGFAQGDVGAISFRVVGNPHGMSCTNEVNPGQVARYVITKIELTDKPAEKSPTSAKGDFSGGLAGTWLKTFAFPSVNESTGVLYDVSVNNGLAQMILLNQNSHPNPPSPQLPVTKPFWYKVTVTSCSDPTKTWVTDPRGDNKGSD